MINMLSLGWQVLDMDESHLPNVLSVETQNYEFPWTVGSFRDSLHNGHLCKLIIDNSQQIVAYVVATIAVEECHILNICVASAYRRQGVARWLLQYVLDEVAQQDAKDVFLEVRSSNTAAIALYENQGFQRVGVRKGYYPDHSGREDALVMKLELVS